MLIGAHVSISGGLYLSLERGVEVGCTSIQIFTKNQMQWKVKSLSHQEIEKYQQSLATLSIRIVLAHDSYLINLGSPEVDLRDKSRQAFLFEMERAEQLQIPYLIFHPGSHKGAGEEIGLKLIAEGINYVLNRCPEYTLKLLLETSAGQGTNLGYTFEQLRRIIDMINEPGRVGVCLDTCHIFAAGYDIRNKSSYEESLKKFDQVIGVDKLYAIHMNDSQKELGSRIDRHEHIGNGQIGLEGFRLIMNDSTFKNIPKILETPGNLKKFKENLDLLTSLVE